VQTVLEIWTAGLREQRYGLLGCESRDEMKNKTRNVCIDVTMRRVLATIVAVGKQ
jgi:hypothetical protein